LSHSRSHVENQLRVLYEIGERRGWTVVEVYQDAGISGAPRAVKTVQGSIACSRMRSGADLML
jgi:hypothetical protein